MRVLITAETFTLSSNIIVDTSTFLLRYAGHPTPGRPTLARPKLAVSCVSSGTLGFNVHSGDDPILRNVDCFRLPGGQLDPPDQSLISICAL